MEHARYPLSEEMYIAGAPGNIHSFLQVMELSPK
jgi:hypothetical protein